jgi:hypothetical protein
VSEGVLNPHQLQMFMSGTELKGAINKSYDGSLSTGGMGGGPDGLTGLWKQKLKESKRSGFGHGEGTYKSIKDRGWVADNPRYDSVNLSHQSVRGAIPEWNKVERSVDDGHHRIAAAADIEEKSRRGGLPGGKEGPNRPVYHFIPVQHWQSPTNKPLGPHSTRDPQTDRD